jgi:hypothetical protein
MPAVKKWIKHATLASIAVAALSGAGMTAAHAASSPGPYNFDVTADYNLQSDIDDTCKSLGYSKATINSRMNYTGSSGESRVKGQYTCS